MRVERAKGMSEHTFSTYEKKDQPQHDSEKYPSRLY